MPAAFSGHGNPLNALHDERVDAGLGRSRRGASPAECHPLRFGTPVPPVTAVTAIANPRTIHDLGGFPPALYEVQYSAPGSPELAGAPYTTLRDAILTHLTIAEGLTVLFGSEPEPSPRKEH